MRRQGVHPRTYRISNYEYWYDRAMRCWYGRKVDDLGEPLRDDYGRYIECDNAYTRREIELIAGVEEVCGV